MDQFPDVLPVLPIRNAVVFPGISVPLIVGRTRSIRAVEEAQNSNGLLLIVAQKQITQGDPNVEDLYQIGTVSWVEGAGGGDSGGRQIIVTGLNRYRVLEYRMNRSQFITARGEPVADLHSSNATRNEALLYHLKEMAREVVEMLPGGTEPLVHLIDQVEDSSYLTHICAAYLNLSVSQKQQLLEMVQVESRIEFLLNAMKKEREVLGVQQEIREKMTERLNKAQREAFLREQLRTIRLELGEEPGEEAVDKLGLKLKEAQLPEEAQKQADEEFNRLRNLPVASAEYHVIRTYLDWLAALPWNRKTESPIQINRAREILNQDHYGLEEVKHRILQFLAVAKLKNDIHGPILCLVGPPGVGKTSLGQSIARALDRKFIRTSLGGVRDESEIRGHRRTYVGAMPGRIIQSIRRAGTRNPLMMLDEIDKLRSDFHGDPSAAMLEVLDPEQNKTFVDHYIDIPFDLSEVFFITTANVVDTIPAPLQDRMEMIEVSSYTSIEKLQIAKQFLVPKQLKEHGLTFEQVSISDGTLKTLITHYTREAGVRELQRKIAALLRVAAERVIELQESPGKTTLPIKIEPSMLGEFLGPEKFVPELAERVMKAGVATGLAWTPHGGDILFIEATVMPSDKSHLFLTGQLGDVMKESAQIALSLVRSIFSDVEGPKFDFTFKDVHIHIPAGSIPKDGPSAGVTILAALSSLFVNQPLERDLAMTGEITLRGAILPVGGIKEKVLAAHRGGITKIVLPTRNQVELKTIPEDVKKQLQFIFVETVGDFLNAVLPSFPGRQALRFPPATPPAADDKGAAA